MGALDGSPVQYAYREVDSDVAIVVPVFKDSAMVDPSFEILIASSGSDNHHHNSKRLWIPVLVVIFVVIVSVVILVVLYRNKVLLRVWRSQQKPKPEAQSAHYHEMS